MKIKILFLIFAVISAGAFAQNESSIIKNPDYKFTFELPANISKPKVVETAGKMSISYTFEKYLDFDTVGVLLVAFKWKDIKRLSDFIYFMEKEVSFNFPERINDYEFYDSVYYDYKIGEYKNSEMHHTAFFYRTKDDTQDFKYTYMLKIKVHPESYSGWMKDIIYEIAKGFRPEKD
jgi:hypothetical protein